jgi:hypothetical protein
MLKPKPKKLNKTPAKDQKKPGLILPLYFGWQVRIVLEKINDLSQHIVGPFKKYWQFISVVLLLIITASTLIFLKNYTDTRAATYNWTQNSWTNGASTTATALHSVDNDNWSYYQSADANLSASSTVGIMAGIATLTHTSSTDFALGIGVGVSTSSDEISLDLP